MNNNESLAGVVGIIGMTALILFASQILSK